MWDLHPAWYSPLSLSFVHPTIGGFSTAPSEPANDVDFSQLMKQLLRLPYFDNLNAQHPTFIPGGNNSLSTLKETNCLLFSKILSWRFWTHEFTHLHIHTASLFLGLVLVLSWCKSGLRGGGCWWSLRQESLPSRSHCLRRGSPVHVITVAT